MKVTVNSARQAKRMPLMFNSILLGANLPLNDVRLLRHQDHGADKGLTLYELWRDNRPQFEAYQSTQAFKNRDKLTAPYWASFVGTPDGSTLFVGLYAVKYVGLLKKDRPKPHAPGEIDKAGTCDEFRLTVDSRFADLDGKLFIEWGIGRRAWIQYPTRQEKRIIELRTEFKEPDFPGYLNFVESLSRLDRLPPSWVSALKSSRGIYLLTCPKTKEQYVGSATGEFGFWQRWLNYFHTGHGGNVGLKSRDPSDYQVSILEVAGSSMTTDEICKIERLWQAKLQSHEMGLNR